MAAAQESEDNVITIDVSRASDGATFALYPLSSEYLRSLNPGVRLWPRVFIARESMSDFQQLDVSLQRQVIQLLTGMSPERLHELGLQVDFFDVKQDSFIATFVPHRDQATPAASAAGSR